MYIHLCLCTVQYMTIRNQHQFSYLQLEDQLSIFRAASGDASSILWGCPGDMPGDGHSQRYLCFSYTCYYFHICNHAYTYTDIYI